jgi:hypothetical protein
MKVVINKEIGGFGLSNKAFERLIELGMTLTSYNKKTDQYRYIWKTDKKWTGCRQLVMKLNDGTYHRANFAFSK